MYDLNPYDLCMKDKNVWYWLLRAKCFLMNCFIFVMAFLSDLDSSYPKCSVIIDNIKALIVVLGSLFIAIMIMELVFFVIKCVCCRGKKKQE